MKSLLRNTGIYAFALSLLPPLYSGVLIEGGLQIYFIAGLLLAVMMAVLKPLFTIITLPLNMATFGMFSFLINALLLYILTILVPNVHITDFVFTGFTLFGFVVPKIAFNAFFAYIICALTLSTIVGGIQWLIKN